MKEFTLEANFQESSIEMLSFICCLGLSMSVEPVWTGCAGPLPKCLLSIENFVMIQQLVRIAILHSLVLNSW